MSHVVHVSHDGGHDDIYEIVFSRAHFRRLFIGGDEVAKSEAVSRILKLHLGGHGCWVAA